MHNTKPRTLGPTAFWVERRLEADVVSLGLVVLFRFTTLFVFEGVYHITCRNVCEVAISI